MADIAEVKLEVLLFDSRHSFGSFEFCALSRVWNCQIVAGICCIAFSLPRSQVESRN